MRQRVKPAKAPVVHQKQSVAQGYFCPGQFRGILLPGAPHSFSELAPSMDASTTASSQQKNPFATGWAIAEVERDTGIGKGRPCRRCHHVAELDRLLRIGDRRPRVDLVRDRQPLLHGLLHLLVEQCGCLGPDLRERRVVRAPCGQQTAHSGRRPQVVQQGLPGERGCGGALVGGRCRQLDHLHRPGKRAVVRDDDGIVGALAGGQRAPALGHEPRSGADRLADVAQRSLHDALRPEQEGDDDADQHAERHMARTPGHRGTDHSERRRRHQNEAAGREPIAGLVNEPLDGSNE